MHSTNTWEQVDQYISKRLIPHDAVLEKVLATNRQDYLRMMCRLIRESY